MVEGESRNETCGVLERFVSRCKLCSHSKAAVSLAYSFDGSLLATASADKTAEIISTADFTKKHVLEGCHSEGLNACSWLDERLLITASDDEKVVLWDVETGKGLLSMSGHTSYVYSLAVNPLNRIVYSGGHDGSMVIFDVTSGSKIAKFDAHADSVASIDYSIQSGMLVTGGHDGIIRIWDGARPSSCIATLVNKAKTPVSNVVFSQSGQYMICSTLDSTHRLYRIPNNDTLLSFQGGSCSIDVCKRYLSHTNKRYSIFSAVSSVWDEARSSSVGSYLASGSEDNKIYLWDLNGDESTPAAVLSGHQDVVLAVACHPDPRVNQIASACRDGSVLFWDTNKPAPDKDQSKEQGDISVNNGDGENRPLRSEENYVIADPQAVIRDVNESTVKMDTVEE